jgi:hypothetical protein
VSVLQADARHAGLRVVDGVWKVAERPVGPWVGATPRAAR